MNKKRAEDTKAVPNDGQRPRVAQHLARTGSELAVTQFEQALICAGEAFYRFYGALLGREGRKQNLTGQDTVILHQIMAATRPLAVLDIARFANRDDPANIQYSLKKLQKAGLIEKQPAASGRDSSYAATPLAMERMRPFLELRREMVIDPTSEIFSLHDRLEEAAWLLNTLAGIYDHGSRVMVGREQQVTGQGD